MKAPEGAGSEPVERDGSPDVFSAMRCHELNHQLSDEPVIFDDASAGQGIEHAARDVVGISPCPDPREGLPTRRAPELPMSAPPARALLWRWQDNHQPTTQRLQEGRSPAHR